MDRPTIPDRERTRPEPAPRDLSIDFARIFTADSQMPGDFPLEFLSDYRNQDRTGGSR